MITSTKHHSSLEDQAKSGGQGDELSPTRKTLEKQRQKVEEAGVRENRKTNGEKK